MRTCLAVILGFMCVGTAQAQDLPISLEITGKEGARVAGHCVLLHAEGSERIPLDQAVPVALERKGMSLGCRIEAKGRVAIVAKRGSSISRASLQNGTSTIQVE